MAGTGLILEKLASALSSWHLTVTSASLKLGINTTWQVSWGSEKCFLCIYTLPKNIFLYPIMFPNTFPDSLIMLNHYFQLKYFVLAQNKIFPVNPSPEITRKFRCLSKCFSSVAIKISNLTLHHLMQQTSSHKQQKKVKRWVKESNLFNPIETARARI